MEVVFVHGFGNELTGKMEKTLQEAFAQRANDTFTVIRWDAGSTPGILRRGITALAATTLVARPKNAAEFLRGTGAAVASEAQNLWRKIQEAAKFTSQRMAAFHKRLGATDTPLVSLVGHSLGCQVVVDALALRPEWTKALHKVVLVSGAVDQKRLATIPGNLLVAKRVVNIFSRTDLVLQVLYRAIGGEGTPIGVKAVNIPGVANIRVNCQHHELYRYIDTIVHQTLCLPGEPPPTS